MRKLFLLIVPLVASLAGCGPEGVPGVSCSAEKAYEMWQKAPDKVRLLDVRTPEEYAFNGHPPMAKNIPFQFMSNQYDPNRHKPRMEPNPNFVEDVQKACKPGDTLLVMCASGPRGEKAAEALRKEGFQTVLYILGGFDGQYRQDCDCQGKGELLIPGWTQQNLPWTAWINRNQVYPRGRPALAPVSQPASGATGG